MRMRRSVPNNTTPTNLSEEVPGISWQRRACYISWGILVLVFGMFLLFRSSGRFPTRVASFSGLNPPLPPSSENLNPFSPVQATVVTAFTESKLIPTMWRVVRKVPHDSGSFTQGLAWRGRVLYEGSGMYGASQLRKVSLVGGKYSIIQAVSLPHEMFGEGVALWPGDGLESEGEDTTVLQLTWTNGKVYTWEADSLAAREEVGFTSTRNEGWGLTSNGEDALVMSDGSSKLHFWNPDRESYRGGSMQQNRGVVSVVDATPRESHVSLPSEALPDDASEGGWYPSVDPQNPLVPVNRPTILGGGFTVGSPLERLNELEWVHGWVLSNVWYDSRIAIIDPNSGAAVWYLDFAPLYAENAGKDCLNGIAYTMLVDAAGEEGVVGSPADKPWGGRLWITGKYWNYLYEIELGGLVPVEKLKGVNRGARAARSAAHKNVGKVGKKSR